MIDEPRATGGDRQVVPRVRHEHRHALRHLELGEAAAVARVGDGVAEDRADREAQMRRDLETVVQPAQPLGQGRRGRAGLPRCELLGGAGHRLAKRGRLPAQQREVAVDPL